ncbi:MFS general substrate transporter [Ascoidea rubescens DSM 1968]|uniref:MFS general substrate transporter n=1 Tax=Ascoidea rubescens DSM 1968 TaxID=1344418 RepID=A0A1D2VSA9_9ASCO|nr:MFS general substrate transporter [Ascoidea rubescens DSM 1968]ODV64455.1 MFS general substrate transporter [Ascoidea rubescens DSM 1968]
MFKSTFVEIICVLIFTLAIAASPIASGIAAISINNISKDFNVLGVIISLGTGSFLLLSGGIADALGRKMTILISFFLFIIFNIISGFMRSFIGLCISRALLGGFIAGATPAAAGMIGSIYETGRRKNRALATFAAGAPVGLIFGVLIGGIGTEILSWRACHFFLAIFFSVVLVLAVFVIPNDPPLNFEKALNILSSLDYVGAFLSLSGFTLFCFALTQVDVTERGWKTPYILATFIIGFLLIVALCFYEAYIPKLPLMPMQIWKSRKFSLSMCIISLSWMNFVGTIVFYSILFFEQVLGYSPLLTTACQITLGVAGILVNVFAAFTLHKITGTVLMLIATLGFIIGSIFWLTMDIDRSYWLGPFWSYIFCVIGADIAYNVVNIITLTSVPENLQSSAAGVFNTIIQISSTIGLAITTALVSARYEYYGTELQTMYPDRLFDGFKNAYWFALGCGILAFILSFFLKVGVTGKRLDKLDNVNLNENENENEKNNKEIEFDEKMINVSISN